MNVYLLYYIKKINAQRVAYGHQTFIRRMENVT
jgi:hypothetical protein